MQNYENILKTIDMPEFSEKRGLYYFEYENAEGFLMTYLAETPAEIKRFWSDAFRDEVTAKYLKDNGIENLSAQNVILVGLRAKNFATKYLEENSKL